MANERRDGDQGQRGGKGDRVPPPPGPCLLVREPLLRAVRPVLPDRGVGDVHVGFLSSPGAARGPPRVAAEKGGALSLSSVIVDREISRLSAGHTCSVTVVLPCLDEAAALPGVLAAIPSGWQRLVVDNGSRDGSPAVAARLGARVVHEPLRGYGAAVHAGIEAATSDVVAVIDCDGSLDAAELVGPVAMVLRGEADLVCGRRRLVESRAWPWHARAGNVVLAGLIRWSTGVAVHDIAPVRVARREALLDLSLTDRRFGYPLETVLVAAQQGWRVVEVDVTYRRRTEGGRSKISGTVGGTLRVLVDFGAVLRHRWRLPQALGRGTDPPSPAGSGDLR